MTARHAAVMRDAAPSGGGADPASCGWAAELALRFEARNGRTVLSGRSHRGPLQVQRPFHPEGDACHVYLLHPPGGVVGGDRLLIDIDVARAAHALATTPAAGKFYGRSVREASVAVRLRVDAGAVLEWLPQENIVFDGARALQSTRIALAADARFIGWDLTCLGRPAAGETFARGGWSQALAVDVDGEPALRERLHLDGQGDTMRVGLRDRAVLATLLAYPACDAALNEARGIAQMFDGDATCAATRCDDMLVCRVLAPSARSAREPLRAWWGAARRRLLGREPVEPRIWTT